MAGPGIPSQSAEGRDDLRAQRIEVELADELPEVRVLLHHDRLVPVLEEVADPVVSAVEGPGIAREQTPHAPGQGARSRPHEEVGVVREHGPGVDGPRPGLRQGREARHKIRPIPVTPEDDPALEPPHHHVVEGVRRIETGLAGHGRQEPSTRRVGTQRPLFRPSPIPTSGQSREEAIARAQALALRVIAERLEHGEAAPGIESVFSVAA